MGYLLPGAASITSHASQVAGIKMLEELHASSNNQVCRFRGRDGLGNGVFVGL